MKKNNLILIILFLILAFSPLFLLQKAKFIGSDDQAKKAITAVAPGYKPWAHYIWKPQSSEVESFLFALQAGIGSFIIGYIIGLGRGKKIGSRSMNNKNV